MAYGEARLFVRRPVHEIAEFILDVRRYQAVDAKLGKIYRSERVGNQVEFTFSPRLLGLPGPPTTQRVTLSDDGSRIDIGGVPSWSDRLVRFAAFFAFAEDGDGTWVTRRVEFRFHPIVSWLLNPLFNRWLRADVPRELAGAKRAMEAGPATP